MPYYRANTNSHSKSIKPEDDILYKKGKLEETKNKEGEIKSIIRRFLQEGLLTLPQIAYGIGVSEEFVEQVRQEMK